MQVTGRRFAYGLLPLNKVPVRRVLFAMFGVLLGGTAAAIVSTSLRAESVPAAVGPTVAVGRGNITAAVSGTFSSVSKRLVKLAFADPGRIQDIFVKVGDSVTTGQPLAHLVSDDYQLKLEQSQAQLAAAQVKLEQLTEGATNEEIDAAQAAYDAALAKYNTVVAGPSDAEISAAQTALAQAQATYAQAQAKLKTLQDGPNSADKPAPRQRQRKRIALYRRLRPSLTRSWQGPRPVSSARPRPLSMRLPPSCELPKPRSTQLVRGAGPDGVRSSGG